MCQDYQQGRNGVYFPDLQANLSRQWAARGGKGKRGHEGPLKQTLRRLVIEAGSRDPGEIFRLLEDADCMSDLYEHSTNPIPWQVLSFDKHSETIEFRDRQGKDHRIKFSTIRNRLSEIRE